MDTVHITPLTPAARAAIAALDAFGVVDSAAAVRLLPLWARRAQLTPEDVKAVIAHYPS